MSQMAGTVVAITAAMTTRPPKRSVQMPSGTRDSEPVSTGMDISRPNWVALRSSIFLIGMPITPNIIQTMKQTVKDKVLTISTDQAWRVLCGLSPAGSGVFAICTIPLRCECMYRRAKQRVCLSFAWECPARQKN